jgi:hypothetical protein
MRALVTHPPLSDAPESTRRLEPIVDRSEPGRYSTIGAAVANKLV